MFDEILYITRGNRSTIIQYSSSIQEINVTLDNYLNSLCLKELTTFKGRLEAIKNNYHLIKNVPIYINSKIVLFTTNNIKSFDNIYINSIYIKSLVMIEDKCKIIFFNGYELIVNNSYKVIKTKYEKCIKIKNQICQSIRKEV